MLPAGDASVHSWFREIHGPRAWRVYLATGFDFPEKKKNSDCLDRSEPDFAVGLLRTLPLYYEGKVKKTIFPKNFVYVLRTTTSRHMVSFIEILFPFSSPKLRLIYICSLYLPMLCHVTHTVSLGYCSRPRCFLRLT